MSIIVFVNEEKNSVVIAKDGQVQELPWTSIYDIASLVKGQEVHYVTNTDVVTGEDIIDLLCEITGLKYDPASFSKTQIKYIRSVTNGKLLCRTDVGEILFNGPLDIKPVDSLPAGVLESSDNIRKCLAAGKLEIIDSAKRNQIISAEKSRKKTQNSRDKAIDSILIKSSVDDFFKEDKTSADAIEIEVDGSGNFKREDNEETYSNLRKMNRNIEE